VTPTTRPARGFRVTNRSTRTEKPSRASVPEIPVPPHLPHLATLEEIDQWLAKYRELVKSVEGSARDQLAAVMSRLEAHRRQRRAELS